MRYPKECVLKACQEACIRPLKYSDERLWETFIDEMTLNDQWMMPLHATYLKKVEKWIDGIEQPLVTSVVAICDGKIIGHGSLGSVIWGALQHVGNFKIMVLPDFRRNHLGTFLLMDLMQLAVEKGYELLQTELIIGKDDGIIEAMTQYDFSKETVLKDYARDINGSVYDVAIMIKRLTLAL